MKFTRPTRRRPRREAPIYQVTQKGIDELEKRGIVVHIGVRPDPTTGKLKHAYEIAPAFRNKSPEELVKALAERCTFFEKEPEGNA